MLKKSLRPDAGFAELALVLGLLLGIAALFIATVLPRMLTLDVVAERQAVVAGFGDSTPAVVQYSETGIVQAASAQTALNDLVFQLTTAAAGDPACAVLWKRNQLGGGNVTPAAPLLEYQLAGPSGPIQDPNCDEASFIAVSRQQAVDRFCLNPTSDPTCPTPVSDFIISSGFPADDASGGVAVIDTRPAFPARDASAVANPAPPGGGPPNTTQS